MSSSKNHLFPIFLKLEDLNLLIVGGGAVGLEKLSAVLSNSPNAKVTLVAPEIRTEITELSKSYPFVDLVNREYSINDLQDRDLVIAATSIKELNAKVQKDCKQRKILVNVADTPAICDFYLSSVVKKGDLKIAISTNGKSPTFAKRIREMLEDVLPEGIDSVLENLRNIRDGLKGDFEHKVRRLNEITSVFNSTNKESENVKE